MHMCVLVWIHWWSLHFTFRRSPLETIDLPCNLIPFSRPLLCPLTLTVAEVGDVRGYDKYMHWCMERLSKRNEAILNYVGRMFQINRIILVHRWNYQCHTGDFLFPFFCCMFKPFKTNHILYHFPSVFSLSTFKADIVFSLEPGHLYMDK